MTDWELLQNFVHHQSRAALDELIRRHLDMVYAAALREVRDPSLADDVTQSVFIVLMRRAGQLSQRVVLAGWLFKVTRYAAADARRRQARRTRHEQEAGKMHTDEPAGGHDTPLDPLLNEAISRLGRAERDAVVLKYLQEKSYAEVAAALAINENAARQRLFRAVAKMRAFLGGRGTLMSEAGLGAALASAATRRAPAETAERMANSIWHGAASGAAGSILAQGVLYMLFMEKVKVGVVAAAAIAVIAGGLYTVSLVRGQGPAPAAGPAATSQPAASPYGPAKTPKGTVAAAFQAMLAGDADGLVSCFADLTPAQEKSMRDVALVGGAGADVRKAIEERFGPDAVAALPPIASGGVRSINIEAAQEIIDGDTALVDIGNAGPGRIPMVKDGEVWKVSPAVLQNFDSRGMAQMAKKGDAMKALAKDIRAGKYETPREAVRAFVKLLTPPRPKPATVPSTEP